MVDPMVPLDTPLLETPSMWATPMVLTLQVSAMRRSTELGLELTGGNSCRVVLLTPLRSEVTLPRLEKLMLRLRLCSVVTSYTLYRWHDLLTLRLVVN